MGNRTFKLSGDDKTLETIENILAMLHHNKKRKATYAFEFNGEEQKIEISPYPPSALADELDETWDYLPRCTNTVLVNENGFKGGEMKLIEDGKPLRISATGSTATLPSERRKEILPEPETEPTEDPEPETKAEPTKEEVIADQLSEMVDEKIDKDLMVGAWGEIQGFIDVTKLAEIEKDLSPYFGQPISKIQERLISHGIDKAVFPFPKETTVQFYESKDPVGGDEGDVEYDFPLKEFVSMSNGQIFNQTVLVSENFKEDKFVVDIDSRCKLWFSENWLFHCNWNLSSRETFGDLIA